MQIRTLRMALASVSALSVILAGCEQRSQATAGAPPTGPSDRATLRAATPGSAPVSPAAGGRRTVVPDFHGKPMWADNRRGTAEENAKYQFEHRGADIGAKSIDDYLTRVHDFFDHPPKDAETLIRSSNGDLLIYSESANLFGVLRKDGAPRLLMKPPTGRAYWDAQKATSGDRAAGSGSDRREAMAR